MVVFTSKFESNDAFQEQRRVSFELALLLLTERARYFFAFNFFTKAMYINVFICF